MVFPWFSPTSPLGHPGRSYPGRIPKRAEPRDWQRFIETAMLLQ